MASAANVCGYAAQLRSLELSSFASSSSARARGLCLSRAQLRSWPKASFGLRKCSRNVGLRVVCSLGEMKKISETQALALTENPRRLAEKLPAATGVYAMLDKNGEVQFIGLSRRISESVLGHIRDVPELCGSVKIALVDAQDRATLTEAWKTWMEEQIKAGGKVPVGNQSGNTTWVRRPRQAKADLRLTPGQHVQLTVSLQELIDKLVKENKVVAFIKGSRTAPQCGFSHRVLTILNDLGVDYESVNVLDEEHNPGLREALKVYSGWPTFPQIFVSGDLVGGADIITEMAEKGELQKLFSGEIEKS